MNLNCIACLAASVDGKISAPTTEPGERIKLGTPKDLERLLRLRETASVICFGASTFKHWPIIRRSASATPNATPPVHLIFTRRWHLPWDAPLFREWQASWPPIFIASAYPMPEDVPDSVRARIHVVALDEERPARQQIETIYNQISPITQGTWLLEGGGESVYYFLKGKVLNKLYLTITPQLIGGRKTPSLVTGEGFMPNEWPHVNWQHMELVNNEIYLEGDVVY